MDLNQKPYENNNETYHLSLADVRNPPGLSKEIRSIESNAAIPRQARSTLSDSQHRGYATDNLKVNGADMSINIGDTRMPAGVETVDIMMYMGENEPENSKLEKKMKNALKSYEVLMQIKFQGLDATLYSKNTDDGYLSELVLYCPSLMNGVILFQGRMSAEEIAQQLMGDGKIEFN